MLFKQGIFASAQRFDVRRRLGQGAMGVVYEAFDRERATLIAIKALHPFGASPDADATLRFKNEFRALQGLQHRNLVRLGELFEDRGQWFFTMELVDGVDLLTWLRGPDEPGAPAPAPARLGAGTREAA